MSMTYKTVNGTYKATTFSHCLHQVVLKFIQYDAHGVCEHAHTEEYTVFHFPSNFIKQARNVE
jgi:hypothetical protein